MFVALLNQDKHWVRADGRRLKLRKMDVHYRANLIPFLRGNACTLYSLVHHVERDGVDPQVAQEWLSDTKLMRRLVELEQGRTIDERRATFERNVAHERATGYQKIRLG